MTADRNVVAEDGYQERDDCAKERTDALADGWDYGYRAAYAFERGEVYPEPTNPYREATS